VDSGYDIASIRSAFGSSAEFLRWASVLSTMAMEVTAVGEQGGSPGGRREARCRL
jgi:hypothetical protein